MQDESPILAVTDLCLQREGVRILDGITWRIGRGEHWALLGANGSGKTSLLQAINGYLPPTSGEIDVFGHRYRRYDWQQLRTRIGFVSSSIRQRVPDEETAFETILSGKGAQIGFWGRPRPEDVAEARRALLAVEAGPLEARAWRYLSQGERQRVLVGRALVSDPELLILDEPCAGLDPAAREQFLQFLQRFGASPAAPTLLLVTHHVEEIMPVFTHALVLKAGRVLAAGPVRTTVTSKVLSEAFDADIRVRRRSGRLTMAIRTEGDAVF